MDAAQRIGQFQRLAAPLQDEFSIISWSLGDYVSCDLSFRCTPVPGEGSESAESILLPSVSCFAFESAEAAMSVCGDARSA